MKINRGLTLSEIVVALGLMAGLLLVIIALFTKLLVNSTKNTDLTAANLLARSILDQSVRRGPSNSGQFTTPDDSLELSTNNRDSKTKFSYEIQSQRITNTHDSSLGRLYQVTATVSWWADEVSQEHSRQGYGRLSTSISRTVYVKE